MQTEKDCKRTTPGCDAVSRPNLIYVLSFTAANHKDKITLFFFPLSLVCRRRWSFGRPRQVFLWLDDKPVVIRSLCNNPPMKEQKPIFTAPYFPNGVFVLLTVAPPGNFKQLRVPSLVIKSRFNVGCAAKTVEKHPTFPSFFFLFTTSFISCLFLERRTNTLTVTQQLFMTNNWRRRSRWRTSAEGWCLYSLLLLMLFLKIALQREAVWPWHGGEGKREWGRQSGREREGETLIVSYDCLMDWNVLDLIQADRNVIWRGIFFLLQSWTFLCLNSLCIPCTM